VPATPKRAGREPQPGARFPSEVLGANVRTFRRIRDLNQDDLAERMNALGHGWVRATVSEVERGGRNVTVEELLALALVLGEPVADLLDPGRWPTIWPDQQPPAVDIGAPADQALVIAPELAGLWVRGEVAYKIALGEPVSDGLVALMAPKALTKRAREAIPPEQKALEAEVAKLLREGQVARRLRGEQQPRRRGRRP
jgi:transcriptional regulator with XRE-family HTH domain